MEVTNSGIHPSGWIYVDLLVPGFDLHDPECRLPQSIRVYGYPSQASLFDRSKRRDWTFTLGLGPYLTPDPKLRYRRLENPTWTVCGVTSNEAIRRATSWGRQAIRHLDLRLP